MRKTVLATIPEQTFRMPEVMPPPDRVKNETANRYLPRDIVTRPILLSWFKYTDVVTLTEIDNEHYTVTRPIYLRVTKEGDNHLVEWDAVPMQVTISAASQDLAVEAFCQKIIELYGEWTDPLRENTQEEDDNLMRLMEFVEQVSDPDDEGWLRVAAATHLPRE